MNPEQIEIVVRSIMYNFPEASICMGCVGWKYEPLEFSFMDAGRRIEVTKDQLLAAFPLIRSEKWPKGCTPAPALDTPEAWNEWLCNSDATDYDAFLQLAIFKEVIYG